jgi:triacylglycerol lipase
MPFEFEPDAQTLSVHNARLLGKAAAVAYMDPSACEGWARANGFDEEFDFFSSCDVTPNCDTQGFVAQNAQILLIAFRGTQPNVPVDWLSDFQALHETWGHPIGTVHKGFYEALRAVWGHPLNGKEILPARLLAAGRRAIWITGHSLGGALAELCAAQASFVSHVPVQGVYTFGQPRVGDEAYARTVHDAFGVRIFRMIHDRDIVPRVPFFGMGYRHYGCEVFFDHAGTRRDGTSCVENLAGALQLARLAVGTDAITEAAKMFATAMVQSGFHGNPVKAVQDMVRQREEAASGAVRLLLASGTQNIADHDMQKCYLACLGCELKLP